MPWPAGLRALGRRDYGRFWAGQLVSLIGTWMWQVGDAWLVLELMNSPLRRRPLLFGACSALRASYRSLLELAPRPAT